MKSMLLTPPLKSLIIGRRITMCILITFLFAMAVAVGSCRSHPEVRYVPVESVRTVKETVRDTTVNIVLVPYKDTVSVRDTTSFLQNPYAYSYASFSDGMLHHSLGVHPGTKIPFRVLFIERASSDSIRVPYPVKGDAIVTNKLRSWQQGLIYSGIVAWCYALFSLWKFIRKFFFK